MFFDYFKITGLAVSQIFLLGIIGYFLVKKNILGPEGLNSLSRLLIEVTLPILIFCQLVKDFSFVKYNNWWIFPLASIIITFCGLLIGFLFIGFFKEHNSKMQFLSLVSFQNSGYLPLALIAALLTDYRLDTMLIYLFLFLAGFNMLMFSLGVHIISFHKNKKFELGSLFSPPVIAAILGLVIVFFGLNSFIPASLLKPLRLVGDVTLPLAMFVVGGNLAEIRITKIDKKAMLLMSLIKLIFLPLLGILFVVKLRLPELIGLLIIMQLAMPPATLLSVITRHYKKEDLLISQGILIGHIISIITIPVFLSLYFTLSMIK